MRPFIVLSIFTALVVLLFYLTGCAITPQVFHKEGTPVEQMTQDRSMCRAMASADLHAGRYGSIGWTEERQTETHTTECMAARGYVEERR